MNDAERRLDVLVITVYPYYYLVPIHVHNKLSLNDSVAVHVLCVYVAVTAPQQASVWILYCIVNKAY